MVAKHYIAEKGSSNLNCANDYFKGQSTLIAILWQKALQSLIFIFYPSATIININFTMKSN